LQRVLHELERSNEQLRKSFLTSVAIFSNLMELRAGSLGGHSRRVADFARKLAMRMGQGQNEVQDIVLAGLLHDIGKIGLPDSLFDKPLPMLSNEEKSLLKRHPKIAQTALMPLDQLKGAATIIRSHHERFDGHGYPDGLSGYAIPLGARILAVANDYDAVQYGNMLSSPLSLAKAYDFIVDSRGKSYDPAVVEAFKELLGEAQAHEEIAVEMQSSDLKAGMVLAKGVFTRDGLLLLFRDCELNCKLIDQMIEFEQLEKYKLSFWVKAPE
jgi:response regulator RpfG family c-di-GMP phosphodiesterase